MASSTSQSEAKDAKTDNFYSPANFAFYATSPYKSLPLVPYHIRLLKVTRDAGNKDFQYELTNGIPLREVVGEYTAISYCAGDPRNTLEILVDGRPFNAFANLVQAIEETCRYLPKDDDSTQDKVLIWTDQICINQSDHHERAAQVSFMYEIYQSAREVAVCLTTHDYALELANGKIDRALECIKEVYRDVHDLDSIFISSHVKSLGDWDKEWANKMRAHEALEKYLQIRIKDNEFALRWWDVVQMPKMPWFTRAWIIQEYAANSKAVFLFANQSVPDHDFAAVIYSYFWVSATSYTIENTIIRLHDIGSAVSSLSGNIFTVQKVQNILRAKSQISDYRHALIDLLDYSRISDASDARDHVYSCLGLARSSHAIQPDYRPHVSVESLFTSVMRVILLSNGGDINLIEHASTELGKHDDALPSWVPDWRESIGWNDADYASRLHNVSAGGHTKSFIDFDESGKVLITKGVRHDILVSRSSSGTWKGEHAKQYYTSRYGFVSKCSPEQGDEVWVLYGGTWPMLLRRKEAGYIFLGAFLVFTFDGENVMSGDWTNNAVDLEKDTKIIQII